METYEVCYTLNGSVEPLVKKVKAYDAQEALRKVSASVKRKYHGSFGFRVVSWKAV